MYSIDIFEVMGHYTFRYKDKLDGVRGHIIIREQIKSVMIEHYL